MKLVTLLILLAVSLSAQDDLIIKFFPGKWKMISEKTEYYEEWKIIDSTELIGKGYSIEAGVVTESETIYLKKFANTWAYVALPKNQAITLFAIKEFSQNKFTFENGEHDFPQRVIYEFAPDSILNAKIEGVIEEEINEQGI